MRNWVLIVIIASATMACSANKHLTSEVLKHRYTNEESEFLNFEGSQIHYRDEGEGEVVVLVHGISSSLHTWDQWTGRLKQNYRVIRFDLPGFGLTGSNVKNEYSIDSYVSMLENLLVQLNVSQCYLVGSSLGGWIAWEYTYLHPDRVQKLVLMNAAGFTTPDDPPKPIRMAQKPLFKNIAVKGAPKFLVRKFLKQAFGDRSKVDRDLVTRYYELNNYPGNPLAFYTIANSKYKSNTERLSKINQPTLILWGEEDKKWIDISHAYLFQELLPMDQLITYPGVGHLPMEEAPEQSVDDTIKFFEN